MVVQAILDNVRHRVFQSVLSREDIPEEFGSFEDVSEAVERVEGAYKESLRRSRLSIQGELKLLLLI